MSKTTRDTIIEDVQALLDSGNVFGARLCCAIFDEIAFWRDDKTATPDTETYTAILPSLLTTKGLLVGISSAYRRSGLLFSKYRDYYGVDNPDTLFIKGDTTKFNQIVDMEALASLQAADPTAAKSEWQSEFRDDLSGFLDDRVIDQAINRNRPLELAPKGNVTYRAHTDP
jgi:hypothetical protein